MIVEHEISWKKCQYRCKKGYYFDQYDGGCLKSHFSCTDGDDVTNATLVWSGNNGLVGVDNQTKTLIWTWENPTKTCQYKCKTGYERKKYSNAQRYYCAKTCPSWQHLYGNNCVSDAQSKSCVRTWTLPSNATWKGATVTATRNSQKNSWDIPKCDFKCNRWYNKSSDGKSCVVAETPRCTGTIPNATLGSGQDLWLTGTQQITLVKTIDPNKKCQAVCNPKFELKKEWHNIYCARSNSDNKCKNYEYYNPTTKKCESRCVGQYGYEDARYSYQEKKNSWWSCFNLIEWVDTSYDGSSHSERIYGYYKNRNQLSKKQCLNNNYAWWVPIEKKYIFWTTSKVTKLYTSCEDNYDWKYCEKVYDEQDLRECSDFWTEESCRKEQSCLRKS